MKLISCTILGALFALPLSAQTDIQQKMLERMQKNKSGNEAKAPEVKVEDDNDPFIPNQFTGSFRMEMHQYKNGKEEKGSPVNMQYWSSPEMTLVEMAPDGKKQGTVRMLTDLKGKWNYMLMTDEKGEKTGMKSRKKKITVSGADEEDNTKFTVTNETKVIEGHTCNKVIGTNDDGTWTAWIAKDIDVPFTDMSRSLAGNNARGKKATYPASKELHGFPLEMESLSADGKDRTVIHVRELKLGPVDPKVFSIEGYQMMEMPFGMPLPGQ